MLAAAAALAGAGAACWVGACTGAAAGFWATGSAVGGPSARGVAAVVAAAGAGAAGAAGVAAAVAGAGSGRVVDPLPAGLAASAGL